MHGRVTSNTDNHVPPCFCILQSSTLRSDSEAFCGTVYSHHSFNLPPPRPGAGLSDAPRMRGLRILEIVMENKGGVTIPRWAFGLAAAVVALLVVLVIVLIPRGGDNSSTSAAGGSNGAAQSNSAAGNSNGATQSKSTSTVEAGTCGAGASDDQSVLSAAPKDTAWVTTDAGWIGPVSKTAGPMVNSPIRSCFEHSAEGALYAAVWASIEINEAPEAYMPTVVGPGAEAARQNRKGDTKTRTVTRVAGYRYVSYTPERATVRVLFQIPSGAYRSWDVVMEWHDGDWHFWVPSTLPQFSSADPDDFITWGS